MRIEPEISGLAVVLLGDFNPAIFTPAWFTLHGLLPRASDSADLKVAHRQVTEFSIDWLRLQVTSDRFAANTVQAPHVRVKDLVMRVFKEHLSHTPLKAMGINRSVHFQVGGLAERDRIGRALAPVAPWGHWAAELGVDGEQGGMTSLTMSQVRPAGRPRGGSINVKVEPSRRIGEGRLGIFVEVNDHYLVSARKPPFRAEIGANAWHSGRDVGAIPAATEAPDGLRTENGGKSARMSCFQGQ